MSSSRILVVEDQRIVARDIQEQLEEMAYSVPQVASSGSEALEYVEEERPDLVLMDIRLEGDIDGIETAQQIRRSHDVPVVYLTAYADDTTVERAKMSEPYGYLLKPFENRDLRATIETALYKHRMEVALRREQTALTESESRYRFLFDHSPAIYMTLDVEGVITEVNTATCELTGYAPDEIIGKHMFEFFSPQPSAHIADALRALLTGTPFRDLEVHLQSKTGLERVVLMSAGIQEGLSYSGVSHIACLLSGIDITDRKMAEERLAQSQKQLERTKRIETIGKLAGGIAHHYNNLLTVIQGNAQLLMTMTSKESDQYQGLRQIVNASQNAADLTRQLLSYGHRGTLPNAPVNINHIIQSVVQLLRPELDTSIQLQENLYPEPLIIMGETTQIQRSLLDLAINAKEAMPSGGTLEFATEITKLRGDEPQSDGQEIFPGYYVQVTITDTGVGMDANTLEHIFEPFFSTKPDLSGTGLTLPAVYGCIRNHHGTIDVQSKPNQGTTVRLCFPLIEQPVQPSTTYPAPQGSGHVLVVDDEETVRVLTERILQRQGYTVTSCRDGEEAVEYVRSNPGKVDLAIIDMIMPKLNGVQTLQGIHKYDPNIRAILSSGFTPDSNKDQALQAGFSAILLKPFPLEELLDIVSQQIQR